MPLPKSSLDASAREETSRVQNLSSVAPPSARDEGAERTHDVPTFVPPPSQSQALRLIGWVMVIGGAVALALVLIVTKLRSAPAAQQAAAAAPLAVAAAPQPAPQMQEMLPPQIDAQATAKAGREKRGASAAPAVEANVTNIRIRARVAPVRAAPEPDAKVVCSVKRRAVMRSLQQTVRGEARWFAVYCDKDSPGWLHENFVTPIP